MNDTIQRKKCLQHGSEYLPPADTDICGVAVQTLDGRKPIVGCRVPPEIRTCGWYIWAGEEFSEDADFFQPMHVECLVDRIPEVLPFLALEPGFRFVWASDHEDVWFDPDLLKPPGDD